MALTVHKAHRAYAVATGFRTRARCRSLHDESNRRRGPGCFVDRSDDQHRWKRPRRPGALSRLLRDLCGAMPRRDLLSGRHFDIDTAGQPTGHPPALGPRDRHQLQRLGHSRRHRWKPERLLGDRQCCRTSRFRRHAHNYPEFRQCDYRHLRYSDLHRPGHAYRHSDGHGLRLGSIQHRLRESLHARRHGHAPDRDCAFHPDDHRARKYQPHLHR